jgi:hypothetical protein
MDERLVIVAQVCYVDTLTQICHVQLVPYFRPAQQYHKLNNLSSRCKQLPRLSLGSEIGCTFDIAMHISVMHIGYYTALRGCSV